MLEVSEDAVSKDPPAAADDPPQIAFPLPLHEATVATLPRWPQTCTHKLVGDGWPVVQYSDQPTSRGCVRSVVPYWERWYLSFPPLLHVAIAHKGGSEAI